MMKLVNVVELSRLLLTEQEKFDKSHHRMTESGLEFPQDFDLNLIDIVADLLSVPKDNVVEMRADDIANETGEWPDGAYCRDWLHDEWRKVWIGESTIDVFMDTIQKDDADES